MEEFSVSSKKRKFNLKDNTCCFCLDLEQTENIIPLDSDNIDILLPICRDRNDDIGQYIFENEQNVRDGSCKIGYHKLCRSTYLRPLYPSRQNNEDDSRETSGANGTTFTRSKVSNPNFDWKRNCFICGQQCHEKKKKEWSMVEGCTDSKCVLYKRLIEAAEIRNDQDMKTRLNSLSVEGDLVAAEARYHRKKACLSKYISITSIVSQKTPQKPAYGDIALLLRQEFEHGINDEKNVYQISALKARFMEIAKENSVESGGIYTNSFKRILKHAWPELKVIPQPGTWDLVCSPDITLDEAVNTANKFGKALKEMTENELVKSNDASADTLDDSESILHRAAGILRNRLAKVETNTEEYFSPEELTLSGQKTYVDNLLYKFIGWIASKQHFDNATDINDDIDPRPSILALCCDITSLVASVLTPKHLGLSVHLHHMYGSRKLIDELHALGYTMAYTEVRRFLTSAAVHMTNSQHQTQSGAVVPTDVKHRDKGGKIILAAADNWDHNENTIDGKHSTHAMTTILVTPRTTNKAASARLSRVAETAIPGGGLANVLHYQKPVTRPQPVLVPPPRENELKPCEPESAKIIRLKDLLYNIGRCDIFCDDRSEPFPPWTIYQSIVTQDKLQESSDVIFNPIIMATPTHYSTVYTTLKRVKEQMSALGQSTCPTFFDMGLLTKALEVVWARDDELHGVVPIEGGMHFLMSVFAGIGYLYGDAGLEQLLCDSDVFAAKTAKHILSGKDFDRALRAVLLVDEVLNRRMLIQFKSWCDDREIALPAELSGMLTYMRSDFNSGVHEANVERLCTLVESSVLPILDKFRAEGREVSPTFKFLDDYLQNVLAPLKMYLGSSRHAMWDVYEYSKSKFFPFFFAANRTIYARYMPYQVCQMRRLPEDIKSSFNEGHFVAKLTSGTFNSVWLDYALEVTENKALKSLGGIIGITHRDGALSRWFLSHPVTAKYSLAYTNTVTNVTHNTVDKDVRHIIQTVHHLGQNTTKVFREWIKCSLIHS